MLELYLHHHFFVTQIVKGNNRRWRGDGLLTPWTRSHQPQFFEVMCTVNTETTPICEITWWSKCSSNRCVDLYLQKVSIIISNNWQPSLSFTKNCSVIIHPAPIDYNGIWLDKSPCNSLKIWKLCGSHCSEVQNTFSWNVLPSEYS